jgi:serine/threonine protein kinase
MANPPPDKLAPTEEYKLPASDAASFASGTGPDTDLSQGVHSNTGIAPSFHSLVPKVTQQSNRSRPPAHLPDVGDKYADFELIRVLGTGSFAKVFLARQLSLDRQVALKVSANRGSEARTLASLEHDHIVQIFSEIVDRERNLRLLCMQYVPGATLDRIIGKLRQRDFDDWSGRTILAVIDELSTAPAVLDPAALQARELLGSYDFVEAVCHLGACLARALAHAHSQQVLHRDIKPANVLFNRYGRPFLADFNLAHDTARVDNLAEEVFGGTLAYMAPEHLDAFDPTVATTSDAVDERSDIYSFGVVLYELISGKLPFRHIPHRAEESEALRSMAAERRAGVPRIDVPTAGIDKLERVIRRCLDPNPEGRCQTAAELACALDGCFELRCIEKELPTAGRLAQAATTHPVLWLWIMTFFPHVLATAVNISYNALRIAPYFTAKQQTAFIEFIFIYNPFIYTICIYLMYRLFRPIGRVWPRVLGPDLIDSVEAETVRCGALQLPRWAGLLAAFGWIFAGIAFPVAIHLLSDPVPMSIYGHFLVSFTISGLIAVTYSVFGVQYVVLRVLYPRLWGDGHDLRVKANHELRGVDRRLRALQLMAGSIPLSGAILMIGVGPERSGSSWEFRLLVSSLIILGICGFAITQRAATLLSQTLTVLLGVERQRRVVPPSVILGHKKP